MALVFKYSFQWRRCRWKCFLAIWQENQKSPFNVSLSIKFISDTKCNLGLKLVFLLFSKASYSLQEAARKFAMERFQSKKTRKHVVLESACEIQPSCQTVLKATYGHCVFTDIMDLDFKSSKGNWCSTHQRYCKTKKSVNGKRIFPKIDEKKRVGQSCHIIIGAAIIIIIIIIIMFSFYYLMMNYFQLLNCHLHPICWNVASKVSKSMLQVRASVCKE